MTRNEIFTKWLDAKYDYLMAKSESDYERFFHRGMVMNMHPIDVLNYYRDTGIMFPVVKNDHLNNKKEIMDFWHTQFMDYGKTPSIMEQMRDVMYDYDVVSKKFQLLFEGLKSYNL